MKNSKNCDQWVSEVGMQGRGAGLGEECFEVGHEFPQGEMVAVS